MQRLYVGGGMASENQYVDIPGQLNAAGTLFFIDEGAPAGNLTYVLRISSDIGIAISERNLALLELKR